VNHLRAAADGVGDATSGASAVPRFDRDRFARHIIENFVGDAFRHGVFHADLHPANLIVLPGEVVGYVDFGITGVLSGFSRRHLVALTLAVARADVDAMADAFLKLAASDAHSDPDLFRRSLADVSRSWYEGEGSRTVLTRNFTLVMLDMLVLCRKSGILPERDVIKYIRSAVAADGLITRLAPRFNVGRCLQEACEALVTEELRRTLLSPDTFAGAITASRRLLESGAARAAVALRRVADGEVTAFVAETAAPDPDTRRRQRTIRLAGLVVALVGLLEWVGGPAHAGLNVMTITTALTGLALLALLDSIRRLVRSD